jgi:signal transduction histidine kinase
MDSKKKKLLKEAFDAYITLMLYDFPLDRISEIVVDNVTGYGTTVDERVLEVDRLKKIVADQREQGAGLEMHMNMIAVTRRISPDEDTAIFMDEFEISMVVEGKKNVIPLRLTSVFEFNENTWKLVHLHGSKAVETEGDTWHLNEWKKKNEELQKQVEEKTAELLVKNRELEIEAALERIRAQVTAMQESSELLDIVVMMQAEFTKLGHEAHYFWHMRWFPDKYEKALTNGEGTRIGNVLELPRGFHGLKNMMDWEQSDEPTAVFALEPDIAADYIDKMIKLGRFQEIDHSAPGPDEVRDMGGLTFVMARTTHGEIGYTLPGEVPNPPQEDIATLARFAGVFDLAYKRFEDLKTAEKDLIEIKAARLKAEQALAELKATQSQLIHSEKMASLGELTAGIAHEIQNPLNFVNNFSEVSIELVDELKQESAVGSQQSSVEIIDDIKQNLEKILHHGKRADAIVKGMLQHSRTSSGQKELTDINALADEYLRLAYHGLRAKDKDFNAVLKTDFDDTIGKINVIPQDIGRVILNLITNAFFAVNEKKQQLEKDLSALSNLTGQNNDEPLPNQTGQNRYEPTVTVSTKRSLSLQGDSRGEVLISVKDNGNGIPEEIKDKIFQPFFTTKPTGQGTGLGLSLSYDIVKAHGGELKVETKEGTGSEFTIRFPIQ